MRRALFLAVLAFFPILAQAVICTQVQSTYLNWFKTTAQAAADSVGPKTKSTCSGQYAIYPHSVGTVNEAAHSFTFYWAYCGDDFVFPTAGGNQSLATRTGDYCEDDRCQSKRDSVPNLASCNAQFCTTYTAAPGAYDAESRPQGDSAGKMSACDAAVNGCMIKFDAVAKFYVPGGANWMDTPQWQTTGANAKYDGSVCTESELSPGFTPTGTVGEGTSTQTVTTPPLPSGKCNATFNDKVIVVDCATGIAPVTKTTVTETVNPDGSVTTKTVTKTDTTACEGNTCVTSSSTRTTTSTKPADGGEPTVTDSVTKDGTATTGKGGFCEENAGSPLCKDGEKSKFGGSCTADFQCEGDAAMCATARATNKLNCSFEVKSDVAEVAAYQSSVAAGTGTAAISSTVPISSGSFDQSNALGVGAVCIADVPITVMGQSMTVQVSRVCPYLDMLGTVLLALSFLSAIMIVGKPS